MPLSPASLDRLLVPPLRDALVAAVALALRLPLLPLRRMVEGDGAIYASLARQAAHGDAGGLANQPAGEFVVEVMENSRDHAGIEFVVAK